MGLIIDDQDVCPKCGAYWQANSYWCANGHPRPSRGRCTMKNFIREKYKKELTEKLLGVVRSFIFINELGGYYCQSVEKLEKGIRKVVNKSLWKKER